MEILADGRHQPLSHRRHASLAQQEQRSRREEVIVTFSEAESCYSPRRSPTFKGMLIAELLKLIYFFLFAT